MELLIRALALTLAAAVALLLIAVLRRPLWRLVKLLGKTGLGLGALALLKAVGSAAGLALGVNVWNALVLALLGVPGLGLLLMLNWITGL